MSPEQVLVMIQEQLDHMEHIKHIASTLKPKKIYKIIAQVMIWKNSKRVSSGKEVRLVASIKTFNKESIRFNLLAANEINLESIEHDFFRNRLLTNAGDRVSKMLLARGVKNPSYYRVLSPEHKELVQRELKIDNIEMTLDYSSLQHWEEFDPKDAPLCVSWDYISPKFKKEFFKA